MDNNINTLAGHSLSDVILFRVGGTLYALSIGHVSEILNETNFTPLPRQPDYCHGAINLRGNTTYIIDLGALLFPGAVVQNSNGLRRPIVILNKDLGWDEPDAESRDIRFGLMIDEVQDVLSLNDGTVSATPAGQSVHQLVSKVVNRNEQLIGILDPFRLRKDVIVRWNDTETDTRPKPMDGPNAPADGIVDEVTAETAVSAVQSINERIVPILTRHIQTVRKEAEEAAIEISRLLTRVTGSFENVEKIANATTGDAASTDTAAAFQRISKLNQDAKAAVHSAAVYLQFADKISQILGRVGSNLSDLGQMVARGEIGETELENWLNSMYNSYTTAAEKENHLGRPVDDDKSSSLTFF